MYAQAGGEAAPGVLRRTVLVSPQDGKRAVQQWQQQVNRPSSLRLINPCRTVSPHRIPGCLQLPPKVAAHHSASVQLSCTASCQ